MSGVVGVCNVDRAPVDVALLADMTRAMGFRGPDGQRWWAKGHVGLGHTQFRTTGEAAGETQPCSVDGDVWIAADARVDGRDALVSALRGRGREVAAGAPEAELILHAYLAWGDGCLDHLIGDFAFVVWDGRHDRLLAARDQLGVAQLFYVQRDGVVLVGNTLQGLLRHPAVPDSLDEQTMVDLALFTMPLDDSATGYAAIRRLPPGHALTCDGRGLRVERYWALRPPQPLRYRRPEDYAEQFRLLFDQAVNDRVRTDRVATQLSGGMDSTSVAVTAHQRLRAAGRPFDLRAYSIEYPSLIPDEEGRLAVEVARHAGFPVDVLDGEAYLNTEPGSGPAWVPPEPGAATLWVMEELCRRAAASAPVLLAGYGGDPLLCPPAFSWRRAAAAVQRGHWRWPLRPLAARWRRREDDRRARVAPLPAWVNPLLARRHDLAGRAALFRQRARTDQIGLVSAPLWRALFAWSDAGYNGRPLSIRFPFFDLRLLEFVLAIPPVPWLESKRLLRAAMGDRLPPAVRTRRKTVMAGNVALEQHKRTGVPRWQIDLLAAPEMAGYVDERWLAHVRSRPAAAQAEMWAAQRPPVELGYWLLRRRSPGATPAEHLRSLSDPGGMHAAVG